MLKRRKNKKAGIRESSVIRCASHLAWVRGHECAVAGKPFRGEVRHNCFGKIEAAHVRIGGNGGTSMKPGDDQTIPLCSEAHHIQHTIGERSFSDGYKINMREIAAALWAKSPHALKYRLTREKETAE